MLIFIFICLVYLSEGQILTSIAGIGNGSFSGENGPASQASLFYPTGIFYSDGLFVADTYNNRVRLVNPLNEKINTIAGNGLSGYSGDGGSPLSAAIDSPASAAYLNGNLFISESRNNRIRMAMVLQAILVMVVQLLTLC